MELAKITLRGKITILAGIRKRLCIKDGDKVVFIEENGRIIMENSVDELLDVVQRKFPDKIKDVDLFIIGDSDFDDIEIDKPEILTPTEFLIQY
ncbi:MAG: hypothetical protein FWG92_06620 [Leptospirales bacterium]|nr:hypothetical protein [Leptospirales bacterium]